MRCPQHYLTNIQEVILFYNGLEVPTRQILDSKGAIPTMIAANTKIDIQEMVESSYKWHNSTSTRMRILKLLMDWLPFKPSSITLEGKSRREDKIIFKTIKPASSLIKRVYMLSLRERMELDLEARLMGETLILNRLLDPLYGDYIELNDLNEPLELKRNQVNDFEPAIEEGEVDVKPMEDVVKTRRDDEIVYGLDEYHSYCDFHRKIHIKCAYNLKFSCMIDFAVVKDMDIYRDDGMGNVIVGKPFCRKVCVKTKQFGGMITICNDDDSVTYQMVRSHLRFKHLTNEKCKKIPSLLMEILQIYLITGKKLVLQPRSSKVRFINDMLILKLSKPNKDSSIEEIVSSMILQVNQECNKFEHVGQEHKLI
nr:hypothetical protein [Tanacetum cinerariifolium]